MPCGHFRFDSKEAKATMNILEHCTQDHVEGVLWRSKASHILTLSPDVVIPRATVVLQSPVVVRYAIARLGPNHLSVVPAVFVSEKGSMLYGHQAWQFMVKNYQLYPRAEVLGLQSDGDQVQYFLRELDFADQFRVLAYENADKTMPTTQVDQLWSVDGVQAPPLLATLLPLVN